MAEPNFAGGTVWTGDCLDVLRGMNAACVDLIYADPPFNSNRDYAAPIGSEAAGAAFKDTWTLSDVDVYEHGELADRKPAASAVIEAARQAHGASMQSYLVMMAVRLIEMRRVLRDDGSIYLHCDDAAGHWLRGLMDAVFGIKEFWAEIKWKRTSTHNDRLFGSQTDTILMYGGHMQNWDAVRVPLDKKNVESKYRYHDRHGQYRVDNLTGPGLSDGESGQLWQGYDPGQIGRCWSVPKTGDYARHLNDVLLPGYLGIAGVHDRLNALADAGMIHYSSRPGGMPSLKRYLRPDAGQLPGDLWTDIDVVNSQAKERTGYPTQKPLALLERIILASTNVDDLVLDPFCGCATALVVADRLGRQWAGIDLSPLAIKLVNARIAEDRGPLWGGATALDVPPVRTDLGTLPNYRTHRHRLYGEQEGVCVGCDTHFPFRVMDVDHILPRSKGGTDHADNLQMLCSGCNRSKGGRTMAEWRAAP